MQAPKGSPSVVGDKIRGLFGEMKSFRWGIFGTGGISAKFVAGLRYARDAEVQFVASRSMESASRFAKAIGAAEARCGYADAARRGGVDAIYIATPPSEHLEHALYCIEEGIPILVEKPLALRASDARLIADAAGRKSVFAMEAMWTRFLPATLAMRANLAGGSIGEVRAVVGSFGTSQIRDARNNMFNPALGGGVISHLAAYPLSLCQWFFGPPISVSACGTIGPSGVAENVAFQLRLPGEILASFIVSLTAWAADDFQVYGSDGMMALRGSIVRPYGLSVVKEDPKPFTCRSLDWRSRARQHPIVHKIAQLTNRTGRARPDIVSCHYAGNGYQYQADELRTCVEQGLLESRVMSLADSINVAEAADAISRCVGLQKKDV